MRNSCHRSPLSIKPHLIHIRMAVMNLLLPMICFLIYIKISAAENSRFQAKDSGKKRTENTTYPNSFVDKNSWYSDPPYNIGLDILLNGYNVLSKKSSNYRSFSAQFFLYILYSLVMILDTLIRSNGNDQNQTLALSSISSEQSDAVSARISTALL